MQSVESLQEGSRALPEGEISPADCNISSCPARPSRPFLTAFPTESGLVWAALTIVQACSLEHLTDELFFFKSGLEALTKATLGSLPATSHWQNCIRYFF